MNTNPIILIEQHFEPLKQQITDHILLNVRRIRWGQKIEDINICKRRYFELIYSTTYNDWILKHAILMDQSKIEFLQHFGDSWILNSLFVLKDYINRELEIQWKMAGPRPSWLTYHKTKSQS